MKFLSLIRIIILAAWFVAAVVLLFACSYLFGGAV